MENFSDRKIMIIENMYMWWWGWETNIRRWKAGKWKVFFKLKMSNDTFIQRRWLNGIGLSLLSFFSSQWKSKPWQCYCCCSAWQTYLISDYLMGTLVCDIPRQVLHNDKLFERTSFHVLIRIHCCSKSNRGIKISMAAVDASIV